MTWMVVVNEVVSSWPVPASNFSAYDCRYLVPFHNNSRVPQNIQIKIKINLLQTLWKVGFILLRSVRVTEIFIYTSVINTTQPLMNKII